MRISAIYEHLKTMEFFPALIRPEIVESPVEVLADELSCPYLESFHTKGHIYSVYRASGSLEVGENSFGLNEDNYENKHTFSAAKVAADAVLTAANEILTGKISKAYALVRPPGHHAH